MLRLNCSNAGDFNPLQVSGMLSIVDNMVIDGFEVQIHDCFLNKFNATNVLRCNDQPIEFHLCLVHRFTECINLIHDGNVAT